ncbi:hypothetical protein ACFL5N_01180 [bacterium]
MNIKNIYFLYASVILVVLIVLFNRKPSLVNADAKGSFVFDSIRHKSGVYILKKGKVRFLTDKAGFPKWSPDGKRISCISYNKILFFDADKKREIDTIVIKDAQIFPLVWMNNGRYIIFPLRITKKDYYEYYLVKYDLSAKEYEKIFNFGKKTVKFDVKNLCISNDDRFLAFWAGSNNENAFLYYINLETKERKTLWKNAYPVGWAPDTTTLIFSSENDRGGEVLNDALGSILSIDIAENKVDFIEYVTYIDSKDLRLSKDGKNLYYSKKTKNNGYELAFSDLEQRSQETEILITRSFYVDKYVGYSKDISSDWYISENIEV